MTPTKSSPEPSFSRWPGSECSWPCSGGICPTPAGDSPRLRSAAPGTGTGATATPSRSRLLSSPRSRTSANSPSEAAGNAGTPDERTGRGAVSAALRRSVTRRGVVQDRRGFRAGRQRGNPHGVRRTQSQPRLVLLHAPERKIDAPLRMAGAGRLCAPEGECLPDRGEEPGKLTEASTPVRVRRHGPRGSASRP